MTDLTPAVRSDLAPTGKLRAAINYGNFILATKDRATGESRGVAIDLTQELGRRLGVPVEIVAYDSVAVMGDAAPTGVWDIAFLGSDPKREALMSFTAAYLEIEATYLVPGTSKLRTAADVDQDGVRVAAPARANYELYLSRNLKHARLVSTQGGRLPRWRGDGKELYYLAADNRTVMAVDIRPSADGIQAGTPQRLFSSSTALAGGYTRISYEVTPDGQRFLVQEPTQLQSNPLNVVVNWLPAKP